MLYQIQILDSLQTWDHRTAENIGCKCDNCVKNLVHIILKHISKLSLSGMGYFSIQYDFSLSGHLNQIISSKSNYFYF